MIIPALATIFKQRKVYQHVNFGKKWLYAARRDWDRRAIFLTDLGSPYTGTIA